MKILNLLFRLSLPFLLKYNIFPAVALFSFLPHAVSSVYPTEFKQC